MKLKYIIISLIFANLFSCKEGDSYDVSKVTVFPTFELEPVAVCELGTSFTPAAIAMEGDEILPVTIIGDFSTDIPGVYTVGYSATNSDGYSKTAQQLVFVYDPTSSIDLSGDYLTNIVRTEADGSTPRIRNCAARITAELPDVSSVLPGIFYVNDFLGGYYSIGSDYGPDYEFSGYICLQSDGSVDAYNSYCPGWDEPLEDFQNGSYDDITGTLYWEATYAAADIFHVTLTK